MTENQNNVQNQDFGPMSPILRQFLLANHRIYWYNLPWFDWLRCARLLIR